MSRDVRLPIARVGHWLMLHLVNRRATRWAKFADLPNGVHCECAWRSPGGVEWMKSLLTPAALPFAGVAEVDATAGSPHLCDAGAVCSADNRLDRTLLKADCSSLFGDLPGPALARRAARSWFGRRKAP